MHHIMISHDNDNTMQIKRISQRIWHENMFFINLFQSHMCYCVMVFFVGMTGQQTIQFKRNKLKRGQINGE